MREPELAAAACVRRLRFRVREPRKVPATASPLTYLRFPRQKLHSSLTHGPGFSGGAWH